MPFFHLNFPFHPSIFQFRDNSDPVSDSEPYSVGPYAYEELCNSYDDEATLDAPHSSCLLQSPLFESLHSYNTDDIVELIQTVRNGTHPSVTLDPGLDISWDNKLQRAAEGWARQCKFEKDCNECRQTEDWTYMPGSGYYGVGQTLAIGHSSDSFDVYDAIDQWAAQSSSFMLGQPSTVPGAHDYLQMIFEDTHEVGCAAVECEHIEGYDSSDYDTLVVCNWGES